jgi:hypothetical protein
MQCAKVSLVERIALEGRNPLKCVQPFDVKFTKITKGRRLACLI